MEPQATAVYVAYRTSAIDLRWIPESDDVVIVHNDRSLDPARCDHPNVRHVFTDENVGFGAAVNRALPDVRSSRLVLVNPDTSLGHEHWDALATGPPEEVRTIPLLDSAGRPTSVISPYPTAISLALTAWRIGRLFPRGTASREALSRALGRWGRTHVELMQEAAGCRPLREFWVSGAVFSVATDRIQSVSGFDEGYFLYLEDADLCRRLAARYPEMKACVADVAPGTHGVGGSATGADSRTVARHYARSCRRWAARERGTAWRAAAASAALRERWVAR